MTIANTNSYTSLRVLVCGDREWYDSAAIHRELVRLGYNEDREIVIVQGGAAGADRIAAIEAKALGYTVEEYPADWKQYGKGAGSKRNQQMLDSGIQLVLAFHADISQSRGTADMIRRARAANVEVRIYDR